MAIAVHASVPPPLTAAEEAYRHGRWRPRRMQVRAALQRCGVPAARLTRFDRCGALCRVQMDQATGQARLSGWYCRDRFCDPCGKSRSLRIARKLDEWMGEERARAITLTIRSTGEPLEVLTDTLVASFAKLLRHDVWTDNVSGGAAFMEIKRGKGNRGWHPHFHIVVRGRRIDQRELSDSWSLATGGSYRVWIELIRQKCSTISYAAKYASKPLDATIFARAAWLDECVRDLRGRRLWRSLGDWRGRRVEDNRDVTANFRTVGYLDEICREARRGSVGRMTLLRCIGSASRVDEACIAGNDADIDG